MIRAFAWAPVATLALVLAAAMPATAQDASELLVRVTRLEGQLRQMSGQIEQLQFQNRRLEDALRKFQQDVEFRFQESGGKGGAPGPAAQGGPVPPTQPAVPASAAAPAGGATPATAGRPPRPARSDAFDPSLQPGAPGTPRQLGVPLDASGSAPLRGGGLPPQGRMASIGIIGDGEDPGAPLDLQGMRSGGDGLPPPGLPAAVGPGAGLSAPGLPAGALPGGPVPGRPLPPAGATASLGGTGVAKDDYDLAYGLLLQRQYEQSEMAFRQYLQAWPRDRMVATATYWLGETYLRRQRYTDAVEQYLKIYRSYGNSRIAPDSMLKLAVSLRGMGQPEQACATLAEVGRKYPDASADLRAGVEREQKRGNC
ncbi:MAG: tol-pal system protein YbgF [Alsobacter sp.]